MRYLRLLTLTISSVVLLCGCGADSGTLAIGPVVQAMQSDPGLQPAALLIVGSMPLSNADAELRRAIEAAGQSVQVLLATDARSSDAAGRAVVVISESCNSADVGDKFAQSVAGVVVSEPAVLDDMKLIKTNSVWASDYGDLADQQDLLILAQNHPVVQGLGLTGSQRVSQRPSKFVWAKPEATAQVAATISGQPSKAAIFTYDRGTQMAGLEAPGRRAAIFAGRDAPEYFTSVGEAIVTSVIRWAAMPIAVLVVKETNLSRGDQNIEDSVKSRGFAIRRIKAASLKVSDLQEVALAVVSESTQTSDLSEQQRQIFATTTVPLLMFEPALWDDAKMTGPTWNVDFGNMAGVSQIQFLPDASEHLLSAGKSGIVQATVHPQTFLWGSNFGTGVRKVATLLGQPNKIALFAYEKNAALVDGTPSPGRRVGVFADRAATADLTDQGLSLITRAIDWATANNVRIGESIQIVHSCRVGDNQGFTAAFVYENLSRENLYVPHGEANGAQPRSLNASLPTWFAPGRHAIFLSGTTQQEIRWKLGAKESAVSQNSVVCATSAGADGKYLLINGVKTLLTLGGDEAAAGAIVPSDVEVAGEVLQGHASVGHDGSSNYSMPVWLPPAPGGMPNLTLQYNSSRSNERSIMGAGFGLGGLSEIRRCAKTWNRDGQPSSVMFTADDAYCIDGRRLVKVSENESTAEYRTEIDAFAKIVAHGKSASGPEFFEVRNADGSTSRFGDTPDSKLRGERRIQKPGLTGATPDGSRSFTIETVTLIWGLRQRTDVSGWTTTYNYDTLPPPQPNLQGIEWRIADISYGGNEKSHRVADRRVHFAYEQRSDVSSQATLHSYQSGFLRLYTSLLSNIEVHGPSSRSSSKMLRRYKLDYALGSESQALVKEIRECDEFGVCTRPTKFEWQQDTSDKFETIKTGVSDLTRPGLENYWALHTGDFNGDGYSDILYRRLTNSQSDHGPSNPKVFEDWVIRFSDGNVFGPPQPVSDSALRFDAGAQLPYRGFFSKLNFGIPIDLNTDGRTDFLGVEGRFDSLEPHWRPLYSRPPLLAPVQFRWAEDDRNGDGQLALGEIGELYLPAPASVNNSDLDTKFPYNIYVADLDGDGLPELIRPLAPTGSQKFATWGYRKNLGNSFADYAPLVVDVAVDNVTPTGPQVAIFGDAAFTHDLDGDGRVEFLYAPFDPVTGNVPTGADSRTGYVAFTLDHGVGHAAPTNHPLAYRFGVRTKWTGDFNGDGLIDFVSSSNDGGGFSLSLNTGAGFVPYNPDVGSDCPIGNTVFAQGLGVSKRDNGLRVIDFDGDGDDDLVLLDGPDTNYRTSKINLQVLLAEPTATNVNFKCMAVQAANGSSIPAGKSAGYVGSGVSGVKTPGYRLSQTADVDGDGFAEILQVDPSGELVILRRTKGPAHQLSSVTDGRDSRTRFVYTPLSNSTFYQDPGGCAYPFRCSRGAQYVVAAQYIDNGVDPNENIFIYSYEGSITDVTGNGWLGFTKRVVRDLRRSAVTTYEYDPTRAVGNLRPFGGLPTSIQTTTTTGKVKHVVKTNYQHGAVSSPEFPASGVFALRLFSTNARRSEIADGSGPVQVTNVESFMKYQDYFNETYRRIETYLTVPGGEFERRVDADVLERTTQYEPVDAEAWLLSRPLSLVEKHTEKDGSSITRSASFTSDPFTGLLVSQTIEPNGSDDENLSVVLDRNASGQIIGVRKTDRTGNVRLESLILDQTGIFPAFSVNAVGHTQASYYHPGYGVPLFSADENMNVVSTKYDGFMRPKEIRYPTGAIESLDYYGAVSTHDGPSVRRITSAGTETRTFVDRLGRPRTILSRRNPSGQNYYSYTDIQYDLLGRIKTVSQPHFADEPPVLTKYEYDQLDRLTKWTDPAGAVTSREYENRIIRQTEPNNAKKEAQLDLHARLVGLTHSVSSPHADMVLQYAPFSALSRVTMSDPARGTQERVFGYDVLGRQTSADETDIGTRTSKYNAFGDIREATAASTDVLVYQLDGLGRPRRVDDKSTGKVETFTWDGSEHGLGQLAASKSFDDVVSEYGYSPTSQLSFQQNKVGDVALPIGLTYDSQDRLESVKYPGPSPAASVARYFYDESNGELDAVTFAGSLLWKRVVADALGRTRREGFANGTLTFTDFDARGDVNSIKTQFGGLPTVQDLEFGYYPDGDLKFRSDHLLSTSEGFTYDDQRRLRTWSIEGGGTTTWEHDGFGNIKSRLNTGTLGLPSVSFNYPATASNKPSSSSLGAVYTFDGRGRVTANDVHKAITYTPFDLPNRLEAAKGDVFTLTYDGAHARASKVGPEGTTLYVGQHYERVARPLEPLTHVMHIYGNAALADVVWRDGEADYELHYLHRDRLGSVDAVTDRTGKLIERRKFDPFGAPIDPQRLVPVPFPSAFTGGFTGHSHDPDLGLVNMKGRLFDPTSMRFMTPDPLVSDMADSQAWNPYSYVGQMPFRFTDPSGFEECVNQCTFTDGSEINGPIRPAPMPRQTDSEVPGSRVIEDKKPAKTNTADDSGGITLADLEALPVFTSGPVVRQTYPNLYGGQPYGELGRGAAGGSMGRAGYVSDLLGATDMRNGTFVSGDQLFAGLTPSGCTFSPCVGYVPSSDLPGAVSEGLGPLEYVGPTLVPGIVKSIGGSVGRAAANSAISYARANMSKFTVTELGIILKNAGQRDILDHLFRTGVLREGLTKEGAEIYIELATRKITKNQVTRIELLESLLK